jgi:hypothetical protein
MQLVKWFCGAIVTRVVFAVLKFFTGFDLSVWLLGRFMTAPRGEVVELTYWLLSGALAALVLWLLTLFSSRPKQFTTQYVHHDHSRTTININYSQPQKSGEAYIDFTSGLTILEAENVEGVADVATATYGLIFDKDFKSDRYIIEALKETPRDFKVSNRMPGSVTIEFKEPLDRITLRIKE